MEKLGGHPTIVSLFAIEPELGLSIPAAERPLARQCSAIRVLWLSGRSWDPSPINAAATPGWLGLLVVEGLVLRRVTVAARTACEIFGPGDVLRPWDDGADYAPLLTTVDWLMLAPTRVAVLDHQVMLHLARWPCVASALTERTAARARYLALFAAMTQVPRVNVRLLLIFWVLADRWGTVTPDGVVITLPLTHELLAVLAGCRRPTVSIALKRLSDAELLIRRSHDRWLLTHLAMEALADPDITGAFDLNLAGQGCSERSEPRPLWLTTSIND